MKEGRGGSEVGWEGRGREGDDGREGRGIGWEGGRVGGIKGGRWEGEVELCESVR